jgi:hypothetical protein
VQSTITAERASFPFASFTGSYANHNWNHHMSEHAISLLWHGWTRESGFLTVARLLEAIERFNSALVKVCQDMRTDCIDVRSMSGKEEFFYDDCHFTEAGAHELARQISASLKLKRPGG